MAPSNGKPSEMVISDFTFTPFNSNDDINQAVADLRDELASQEKLTEIREVINSNDTNAKKVSKIKTII